MKKFVISVYATTNNICSILFVDIVCLYKYYNIVSFGQRTRAEKLKKRIYCSYVSKSLFPMSHYYEFEKSYYYYCIKERKNDSDRNSKTTIIFFFYKKYRVGIVYKKKHNMYRHNYRI